MKITKSLSLFLFLPLTHKYKPMEHLTPDEIEEKITTTLNDLTKTAWDVFENDPMWTKGIKEALVNLGISLGYSTMASGFDGEWLYDVIWYKENKNGHLIEVPLTVECEWNRALSHIKYDFEKLLASNSKHSLMICQSKPENFDNLYQYFSNAIDSYNHSSSGDRFMVAILDDCDSGLFFYKYFEK